MYHFVVMKMAMTADNSPSRSLAKFEAGTLPAALGPELEDAAGYARAEKAEASGPGDGR